MRRKPLVRELDRKKGQQQAYKTVPWDHLAGENKYQITLTKAELEAAHAASTNLTRDPSDGGGE